MRFVTQNSVIESQPGISVSFSCPAYRFTKEGIETIKGKVSLNVARHYEGLIDPVTQMRVKIKKADCDGMLFDSVEEAEAYAIDRGYLKPFFRKSHGLRPMGKGTGVKE